MAHDNSIASQMEDWIVNTIAAIKENGIFVFEASEVQPWNGSNAGNVSQFTEELMSASRDLICRVFFQGDRVQELEEGEIRTVPQFVVLIGIRNRRPAAARRGDGETIGTNRLRDLLRYALHDKQPTMIQGGAAINDSVTAVDRVRFAGSDLIINQKDVCIQQTLLEVDESPWAGT